MKTNKILNQLLILVMLCAFTKGYSQFANGNATEYAAGAATIAATRTGNDIYYDGTDTWEVSVWDDPSNPGFAWDYNSSGTLTYLNFSFTSFVFDPDVCILDDGNDVYAIAVYHVGNLSNAYKWEIFKWDPLNTVFVQSTVATFAFGSFATTLNIDGNDNADFAIVWDDASGNIKIITGSQSAGPVLNNGGTPVQIASGSCSQPDVCLYHDANDNQVEVVYIDGSGDLYVDFHRFSDLASGTNTPTTAYSTSPSGGYTFSSPRIACPNNSNGDPADWTVVAEEIDFGGGPVYRIVGFNQNACCGGTATYRYNNGTNPSPLDITNVPNRSPVVAYDDQSPYNIWIAWTMDNSGGNVSNGGPNINTAFYPIALKCDKQADIISASYLEVPTTVTNGDVIDFTSLSARFAPDVYATYFQDNAVDDILTKKIASTAGAFKILNNHENDIDQFLTGLNNIPSNYNNENKFTLMLVDLNGKEIFKTHGNLNKVVGIFKSNTGKIAKGIYLAQILSDDLQFYNFKKIYISK